MTIDTNTLHVLRELKRANGKAVYAAGTGYRKLVDGKPVLLSDYLIHEGWAREVWNERGQLQGMAITEEGIAWLVELEKEFSAYLARK